MTEVIILKRLLPHYALPLCRRLWEEFGWLTVTSSNPPLGTYFDLVEEQHDFIMRYPFRFPDPSNHFRCDIPLARILSETGARAVIAEFSPRMSSTYELVLRRRAHGKPAVLFWWHGFNMDRGFVGLRQKLFQLPGLVLAKLTDGHVCYSEEGKDFLRRFVREDRLFVAHNTLDVESMQTAARNIDDSADRPRPHILTIGRLTQDKNFPRLVTVFRQLRDSFPDAVLTIIGDGPDKDRVRVAAAEEYGKSVRMEGAVYDESVLARHYRSSDVVVFPGAVGLSVNHALAYGVPVIAFDRTPSGPNHHPEIAYVINGVTGLRVKEHSEQALLEALSGFLVKYEDPKTHFADSISRYVEENLTLDRIVGDFEKVRSYLATLGVAGDRVPPKRTRRGSGSLLTGDLHVGGGENR